MAFIIDTINGSGLYAQSAASASVATYDSNGNVITATYLTGVDLTPYQTTAGMTAYATTGDVSGTEWNDCYETVQTNSASWAGGGTVESYDLSAGDNIQINKDDVNSAIGIAVTGLNKTNWDSSYTALTSTSGNWNSCYGTVNTNSAAWLKNEDVLFNGTAALTATCSKSLSNYDRIRVYFNMTGSNPLPVHEFRYGSIMTCSFGIGDANAYQYFIRMTADSTHIGITNTKRVYFGGFNSTSVNVTATTGNGSVTIKKIVGVK